MIKTKNNANTPVKKESGRMKLTAGQDLIVGKAFMTVPESLNN